MGAQESPEPQAGGDAFAGDCDGHGPGRAGAGGCRRCRRRRLCRQDQSNGGTAGLEAQRPQAQVRGDGDLAAGTPRAGLSTTVWEWKGLRVDQIEFQGVTFGPEDPAAGANYRRRPVSRWIRTKVTASIRRLFASGRYRDIQVRASGRATE